MAGLNKEDLILKNKIAKRIKNLRENTGLSQSDFAKKNDLDRQIINRWESSVNKRGVTIYTIKRFCDMLNISMETFFSDSSFNKK
ncbi:MAG: helix-turn-helix domain-containing protein [Cellulophaga sp.]|nr:helix-turn-helix domain-containing protein [Cellulophaga sp.]